MTLQEYFENTNGRAVLATADASGKVDIAVYSKPHFIDDETIAFIMADRLTHANLKSNPSAAYLFMEAGEHYAGKRLFLTKTKEDQDKEVIATMRRRKCYVVTEGYEQEQQFLVYFKIDKVLPLIGFGGK